MLEAAARWFSRAFASGGGRRNAVPRGVFTTDEATAVNKQTNLEHAFHCNNTPIHAEQPLRRY